MNIDNYDKIEQDNGDILLKKKAVDLDWMPEIGDKLFYVDCDGAIEYEDYTASITEDLIFDFNVGYASEDQAEKAAELMRRSNAYIRACLLVDPDFVPNFETDWGVESAFYSIHYRYKDSKHCICPRSLLNDCSAYVSTREKAEEVIKLLVKWGVK